MNPEFPKSALGEHVDIGGYAGIVVDIVNLSLKVRSLEGVTKSFNANGLRRIYGPRPEPPPMPTPPSSPPERTEVDSPPSKEKAEPALEPDFTRPVKNIASVVGQPGFPQSALGEHVDIAGYLGVVVQIVHRSLKVRSPAETTRSYNADTLRKLYGKPAEKSS
ncbi:MAG: hypothetical protein U1G07_15215 [Verrucomicrobiota bacterium]